MKEYKKVYRVVRNGAKITMGWTDEATYTLYEGDIIFAQDEDTDTGICLLGMYNNGRWVDLNDTGNFVTLSFKAQKIVRKDPPIGKRRHIQNLKKIVSGSLVSGSMLTFRECLSINTNILEDITVSYRREEKLKQMGI